MSYTKLFQTIITSTIWTEDANTCKVWVTMLAIANKHGEVQASIPGLAQVAGLPLDIVETAINKFLSPDKYSRTPDDEGRRIEKIEGGWMLLNHAKYREMASREEEVASNAKRQAAFRDRQSRNGTVTEVTDSNGIVTDSNGVSQDVTKSSHIADTDTEADTDTDINVERARESIKPQRTRSLATASPLVNKINQINPAWLTMPVLSAKEAIAYQTNELSLRSATGEAWDALRGYYSAKLPEGKPSYRPKSREKFIADFPDVITYAIQWEQSKPKPAAQKAIKQEEGEKATAEDLAAIFGNIRKL